MDADALETDARHLNFLVKVNVCTEESYMHSADDTSRNKSKK